MKTIIYISGVAGGVLLILRLVGIFTGFPFNNQLLVYGLVLSIICLTLLSILRHQHNQKIRIILNSYRKSSSPEQTEEDGSNKEQEGVSGRQQQEDPDGGKEGGETKRKSGVRGLEPGKTSLRERKAGLVWGGGNIKGATSTRGTRRGFLKR